MTTIINTLIALLVLTSQALSSPPSNSPITLPSNTAVEKAIIDFQEEVRSFEELGDEWGRYMGMIEELNQLPILDKRRDRVTDLFKRVNKYTLMGYPAHIRADRNSAFYNHLAAENYGSQVSFGIGPDGFMGKIVLAHEIGHSFGMGEEDADYFAASTDYDLWDLAEYYLTKKDPKDWDLATSSGKDYLPSRTRFNLMAIPFM